MLEFFLDWVGSLFVSIDHREGGGGLKRGNSKLEFHLYVSFVIVNNLCFENKSNDLLSFFFCYFF